jgi:hypothetical protein
MGGGDAIPANQSDYREHDDGTCEMIPTEPLAQEKCRADGADDGNG